jgi:hypothetical protein
MMHLHREPYRSSSSSSLRRSLHSNLFDDKDSVQPLADVNPISSNSKPVGYDVKKDYTPSNKDEDPSANNEDPSTAAADINNQTLQFTLIFLSLMILYIGFCCHYRKVKIRRSVADDGSNHGGTAAGGSNSRRQRAQTNRAVLDESSSAAARAATDEEERCKLEERKGRIMEVLLTRLIVDDDEEEEEECGEVDNEGGRRDGGIDNDEEMGIGIVVGGEEMIKKTVHAEGEGKDYGEIPSGGTGGMEDVATIATVPSSSEGTLVTIPSNETTTSTEEMTSNEASTMEEELSVAAPTPPAAASAASPFRKYADALSCNNCHHHATNYCNNTNIHCNTQSNNNNDAVANNNNGSSNITTTNKKHPHQGGANTITLSTIQQIYGEECNICLSNFQVGDRAAWSKHHHHHSLLQQQQGQQQQQHGCTHVFHEECMSRWLLVRDGCPICRRSYLDNASVDDSEAEGGDRDEMVQQQQQEEDAGEEGRDLESGRGGHHRAIIAAED